MRLRRWLLGAAVMFAFAGGCAHEVAISDADVAHLPVDARARILRVQLNVNTAEQNLSSAEVAKEDTRRFFRVSDEELQGEQRRLDALKLGLPVRVDGRDVTSAAEETRIVEQSVIAARFKRDFAERSLVLRDRQLDERRAELKLARADLDWVKFRELDRYGRATSLTAQNYLDARDRAQREVAEARLRVADESQRVEVLRSAWRERRAGVASRNLEIFPPRAPAPVPAPETIPRGPAPARTDVNEGPSAPMSVPDPNFAR